MNVLGTVNSNTRPSSFDASNLSLYLESSTPLPQVFCPRDCKISVQIVVYQRPNPTKMQYMSLKPIALALDDKLPVTPPGRSDSYDRFKSQLIEKLRLHTVIKHVPSQKELALPLILRQINCSSELTQLLTRNVNLIGTRQRRKLSVSERVVESASTIWGFILMAIWHVLAVWIYPTVARSFKLGLLCHRCIAEVILRIVEWRPHVESAALKDISATAQQIDMRLQQFCYWPIQYSTLRKKKDDWNSVTDSHPEYIRFYNSLWLVANDVIIGIAIGSYIIDNAEWVASLVNIMLSEWTISGLQNMIVWLTDWPAGLKLNNELASFLGDLVLWVIEHWSRKLESAQGWLFAHDGRMPGQHTTSPATHCLLRWFLELWWGHYAHCSLFGSAVTADRPHLLILHCICPYISLAIDNHHIVISSFPGQEAQRLTEPDRLM